MTDGVNITAYSDALIVLGTAGVLVPLLRRCGVNPVLGYLSMGALLGPLGMGAWSAQFGFLYWLTITNAASVSGIAELGIVFLLFIIGLELSLPRLTQMGRLVGGLGGVQVLACSAILTAALRTLGLGLQTAILLSVALSLSTTAIVMDTLSRQGRTATRTGKAVFAILLAQDLAVLPILVFISLRGENTGGSLLGGLLHALLQAAVAVAVILIFGRFLMRPLFRVVASARSAELFIATVLFVIIGSGLVAHAAGLSMALGAFIAGLLLAETVFRKAIQSSIEPFKGLLLGVFFFTVGMRVDPHELVRQPLRLLGCVLALILLKTVVIALLARLFRFSWTTSLESGLLLGPGGEFAFVILGLALDLHLVDSQQAGFALVVVSVSMALTPGIASLSLRGRKALGRRRPHAPELRIQPPEEKGRVIVVGYGRVGKAICTLLDRAEIPFIATDMDAQIVIAARHNADEVYFGDSADPEFLKACGLFEASGVVLTIDESEVVDRIVEYVRALRPDLPIIARARDAAHARKLYKMGASEAIPENLEASLLLGEAVILSLGRTPDEAESHVKRMRQEHRHHLLATLRKDRPAARPAPDHDAS